MSSIVERRVAKCSGFSLDAYLISRAPQIHMLLSVLVLVQQLARQRPAKFSCLIYFLPVHKINMKFTKRKRKAAAALILITALDGEEGNFVAVVWRESFHKQTLHCIIERKVEHLAKRTRQHPTNPKQ